jgi:transposase
LAQDCKEKHYNQSTRTELAAELAKLKRQLAEQAEQAEELNIVKKAATYFVKNLK